MRQVGGIKVEGVDAEMVGEVEEDPAAAMEFDSEVAVEGQATGVRCVRDSVWETGVLAVRVPLLPTNLPGAAVCVVRWVTGRATAHVVEAAALRASAVVRKDIR
jgi:hypothetical protein